MTRITSGPFEGYTLEEEHMASLPTDYRDGWGDVDTSPIDEEMEAELTTIEENNETTNRPTSR